uniref:PSP domain-containing protein n=1 Tax=Onchocerca volvulus TaxID=6282 RepID=A0A2K6WG42_ONCVO
MDTEGTEIVEVEEVNRKSLIKTPKHDLEKEERKILQKASKIKGKDNIFDVSKILTNDVVVPSPSEEKKESTFKISCFNCGGEHTLQQCDIPLNQRRISANRAAHFNNKRSAQERYTTVDDTASAGTCNTKPGEISDALREALGIGPNDIPEWIYRMRRKGFIDGYPPGYLAEALDQNSSKESLLEFHTDDKTLGTPRILREKDKKRKRFMVSADNVIAYPGFNYYNRYLRDRERFRVPRFDEYIRYLQEYVKEKHAQRLLHNYGQENRKRGKYKNEHKNDHKRPRNGMTYNSNDSVILVSDESNESETMSTQSSKETAVIKTMKHDTPIVDIVASTSCAAVASPSVSSSDDRISFGTPVVCRLEHDKKKPSLEKFRDGVVPFEAVEESTGKRGFFRALMLKIRKKKYK